MPNILLLGSYGRGNTGDDAFLVAVLRLLKNDHMTINASHDAPLPYEVQNRVTILNTKTLKNLKTKIAVFLKVKTIIYGGGDLWVELSGDRRPRQSLWKMA